MVEIPDRLMAENVIEQAKEYGVFGNMYDTAYEGEYGQHEFETEWSLSDMNPEECQVKYDGEGTVTVYQAIEATYSARVSRRTRHHPAEYETRTRDLHVSIEMDMGELAQPVIHAQ